MRAKILILVICLLMLGSVLSAEKTDLLNDYWQKLFTEPFETVYIYMKDYTFFPWTSHYEDLIYMEIGRLEEALKKKGYEIKDIAVIIHNHLTDCTFSADDHKQYRRLKKYGFRGLFLLYSNLTKKTYCMEDKKESKMNQAANKRAFPPLVVPIITPLLLTSISGSGVLPGVA